MNDEKKPLPAADSTTEEGASPAAEPQAEAPVPQTDATPQDELQGATAEAGGQKAGAPKAAGKNAKKKKKKKKKRLPAIVPFLIKLVLIGGILWAVFTFILGVHINRGNRMHPYIKDGDLLISYRPDSSFEIGDAVVYRRPDTGEIAVSRIAAVAGNAVDITESGELLVNGIIPEEGVFYATLQLTESEISFPYAVPSGKYFLLDDYRTVGKDSRLFGAVEREDLLGKVVYVFRRRGI